MKNHVIINGLVFGLVGLLVGLPICAVTEARLENVITQSQNDVIGSLATDMVEKKVSSYMETLNTETQQQIQQAVAANISVYIIYSSSGSGHALHFFVKVPHLRNSKGIVFAGFIMHTGLTALTMVWRLTNGTRKVVDVGIGPHMLTFIGIGYSSFNRIWKGGGGSMLAVCFRQPQLTP